MYKLDFKPGWDIYFSKMDKKTQGQIWKKIQKQKTETKSRHMRFGLEFYVLEIGQYRVALKLKEKEKLKTVWFAGNHKQYERWYKRQQA
ncbi:MAG: hypothetical protein JW772_05570 [Candidatus Diapherotrites archaeon]|nr:hypothetical protein [Candidatus Diapherotrites archaeon]